MKHPMMQVTISSANTAKRVGEALVLGVVLSVLPAVLPTMLHAQATVRTAPARIRTVNIPAGGRCSELTSSPTMLLQAPEGRALLRLKRELENAAVVIGQRADSNRSVEIRRISQAQRGVDSLLQIVVRYKHPDGSDGEAITIRRGDSIPRMIGGRRVTPGVALFETMEGSLRAVAPMMDSALRLIGPEIEVAIRSMQPKVAAFSDAARMHLPTRVSTPSGWLGMHLSESKITIMSDEGALTNYCDYPVIEAVDAGSPAEQSGLNSGDTVVAYNGRDVLKSAVNYAELLVPGQVLRMRVQHATKSRDVSVTVAPRPQGERTTDRNMVFVRTPCAPGMVCERSPGPFTFVTPTPPPMPAPRVAIEVMDGSSMAVLAGAQLSIIDDEFAQGIGVDGPGALVLRAPTGTRAAEAGLRAGDVIRLVNGQPVREMATLRRAFSANGSRDVKLTVSSRGTPSRVVIVKW